VPGISITPIIETNMAAFSRARTFWQQVTDGLLLQELWAQFRAEAGTSYEVYSGDVERASLGNRGRARRLLTVLRALFWAMLLKLSPARRVFLLLALVLTLSGMGDSEGHGKVLLGVGGLLVLLALELADRVTMKRDLEIAREIQKWLVPEVPPRVAGMDIAFQTRPANTVAGDYYDAFLRPRNESPVTPERLMLVVADVAGKGVPASLLMATFHASLRTLAETAAPLVDLVPRLNRYACAQSLGGKRFTTAFLAELDTTTRELVYVNAGHNPPLLRRAAGDIDRLQEGGLPLGIQEETHHDSGNTRLNIGDRLVIFTDGVIEAEDEQGDEYGEARLLDLLQTTRAASADEGMMDLMASLNAFVGKARQHDDITCLMLFVQPARSPELS